MPEQAKPTDPEYEASLDRLALWLEPADIAFLADEWRKIPDDAPEDIRSTWARIAFRSMAALEKAGKQYKPAFPNDEEKYRQAGSTGTP